MDSQKQPLKSTTRTFETAKGILTYPELSDLIAPKLMKLLDELIGRLNLPQIDVAVERNTDKFKKYQNALAEYDNGRIDSLVNFWKERFEDQLN